MLFNAHFCLELSVKQIKAYKKNHGLNSGLDGRFNSGHTPFNKGKKGLGGWEPTQFKKGNKPWNYLPVGPERVNGDGYVDTKIADPNKNDAELTKTGIIIADIYNKIGERKKGK